jgi:hypothetical protein
MDLDELIHNADPARGLEIDVPARRPGAARDGHRHWGELIAVVLLVAVVVAVGLIGLSIGSSRPSPVVTGPLQQHPGGPVLTGPASRCVAAQLRLSLGPEVVPQTGEHADMFVFRNTSKRSCTLAGYPSVALKAGHRVLPFVYRDGGGYVRAGLPRIVVLGPRGRGYLLVAKYRCDGQDEHDVDRILIRVPGVTGRFTLTLALDQFGVGQYEYCKRYPGDTPIDPGNYVDVSPIGASYAATLPYALTHLDLTGPVAPSALHICQTTQLSIRMVRSGAGLGAASGVLAFTNRSSARCELQSWPTLLMVTAAGQVSRAKDAAGLSFPTNFLGTPTVAIRPGGKAYAVFQGADGPETIEEPDGKQRTTPCGSPFHVLKITPPGNTVSISISAWIAYLGAYLPACGTIAVSPMMPASSLGAMAH